MMEMECRRGDIERCGITEVERRMAVKTGLPVEYIHGMMDLFEVTFEELEDERYGRDA
jgi:hypothetical protein